jgi:hypothetical protein
MSETRARAVSIAARSNSALDWRARSHQAATMTDTTSTTTHSIRLPLLAPQHELPREADQPKDANYRPDQIAPSHQLHRHYRDG